MATVPPTDFTFGPIELFVVEFEGDGPDSRVLAALHELGAGEQIRVVDLVIAVRPEIGDLQVTELSDLDIDLTDMIDLVAEGLIGSDDIRDTTSGLQPGCGVALIALEMRWAVGLSSALAAAGGRVVDVALIPAPAVNALVAAGLTVATAEED